MTRWSPTVGSMNCWRRSPTSRGRGWPGRRWSVPRVGSRRPAAPSSARRAGRRLDRRDGRPSRRFRPRGGGLLVRVCHGPRRTVPKARRRPDSIRSGPRRGDRPRPPGPPAGPSGDLSALVARDPPRRPLLGGNADPEGRGPTASSTRRGSAPGDCRQGRYWSSTTSSRPTTRMRVRSACPGSSASSSGVPAT